MRLIESAEKIVNKCLRKRDKLIGKSVYESVLKSDFEYGLYQGKDRDEKYLISMASYQKRYDALKISLKSILLQEVKPDKIIVWLDEDCEINHIDEELSELTKYGVEYRHTSDSLMPHKKYYYAMKEFADYVIITVDDDLVYSRDMLGGLIKLHKKYPECVCARRVHKILFDENGMIKPYSDWKYEYRFCKKPSDILFATGGGGTLYPRQCFDSKALDMEEIKKYCPLADDVWLKIHELRMGISVVWNKNSYVMPYEIPDTQEEALNSINVHKGNNDRYIKILFQKYPEAAGVAEGVREK